MESLWTLIRSHYLVATVFTLLVGSYLFRKWKFFSETPPGPWGLPIVGYLPFLSCAPHHDIVRLAKTYGDVFSIQVGSRYVIVLNSYEAIKEALVKQGDLFGGRPQDGIGAFFGDYKNIMVVDGDIWRDQHRFLLSTLRDFGFGKKSLEHHVQNEVKEAVETLRQLDGTPTNMMKITTLMATNAVSFLIFGQRFDRDHPKFKLIYGMFENQDGLPPLNYLDSFPIITSLPPKLTGFDFVVNLKNQIYGFVEEIIDEHEKTYDESNFRDIIDAYLMKIRQAQKEGTKDEQNIYSRGYMRANSTLLFGAGVDTTATTTATMLMVLAAHPQVQEKIQKEIDDVIGRERSPTLNDRLQMPYTEAAMTELQRYMTLLPVSFMRRMTGDAKLNGYKIPKDSFIIVNFWNVHRDPQTWKDPNKFDPDRFLGNPEMVSKLKERVIPFSLGKRSCLGESLAKMQIFIYITTFLQNFTFKPPEREEFEIEPKRFIPMAKLNSYVVCAIPRN